MHNFLLGYILNNKVFCLQYKFKCVTICSKQALKVGEGQFITVPLTVEGDTTVYKDH